MCELKTKSGMGRNSRMSERNVAAAERIETRHRLVEKMNRIVQQRLCDPDALDNSFGTGATAACVRRRSTRSSRAPPACAAGERSQQLAKVGDSFLSGEVVVKEGSPEGSRACEARRHRPPRISRARSRVDQLHRA